MEEKGFNKVAVLHVLNPYGASVAEQFQQHFKGEIVAIEKYELWETSFQTQLLKIQQANPDAIYTAGYPIHNGMIIKKRKEMGMEDLPVMGNDALITKLLLEKIPGLGNNFFGTTHDGSYGQIPESQEFMQKFEEKFGQKPDFSAAFGYDLVVLLDAVQKSGKDPMIVLNELNMPGLNGPITFDDEGNSNTPLIILKAVNDTFVSAE